MLRPVVLALVFFLAGCSGSSTSRDTVLLTGSSWTVERIVYPSGEVVRGDGETIAFGSDGSLAVSSCNTCTGRFERGRSGGIVVDANRCTRRACQPGQIQLERFVSGEQRVERDGPYLILTAVPEDSDAAEPAQVLLLPAEAPSATAE
ncbi:MAG: META domain-containing protein [Bacteroidota bacterium]